MYIRTITKLPTTRARTCTNSAYSLVSFEPRELKLRPGKITRRVLKHHNRMTFKV